MEQIQNPKHQIPNIERLRRRLFGALEIEDSLELGAWDFLLLSSAQNAGGRSEMGQPTVYQKHSTLPSREDDV